MAAGQQRLGSLLVELGFIDDGQLESALDEQARSGSRLGRILVDAAIITEDRLVHALSRQLGIETCDPLTTNIHERVLKLIPVDLAYRHRVLPVAMKKEDTGEVIFVATSDPLNKTALSEIRSATNNRRVRWLLAGETGMEMALARHYGTPPKRRVQPTPLPEGTPVITGKPVSAPKSGSSRPAPRTSDLFMLSSDLAEVAKEATGSIAMDGFGFASEDLPPIEVPPELLASPDAALQIIEAEMPRSSNGSSDLPDFTAFMTSEQSEPSPSPQPAAPLEVDDFEVLEAQPVEAEAEEVAPLASSANGHRPLPPMPSPSQPFGASWGDLVGSDLLLPSVFPWQPDPPPTTETPRPEDTLEVEDDGIEVEESLDPIEPTPPPVREARTIESIEIEEQADPDIIAALAARAREVADAIEAHSMPTDPGTIVENETPGDSTDVSTVPSELPPDPDQEDLPDASDALIEDATEMEVTRAAVMREVLLRFIDDGALEVGPQAILRVLAAIMEKEGLLSEDRIAAALDEKD